ncbi:TetR family transcriptional regulator [Amycolatopsis jejuensis]|uniref:TetR family transcriptional regulator n=1 Tax=Amycolatopsis jejuensis TaxID=330084 RepID=UPI000A888171|nr:TetR family transcriptional regulator [Amycolatopsis jejuensis]
MSVLLQSERSVSLTSDEEYAMAAAQRTGKRGAAQSRTRAPRDPDATRKALVDASLKLFEQDGFHATSVQKIVDEARLTKGAFYYHFETKEDVLHEIHDQFIDFQLKRLNAVLAEGGEPDEVLRRIMTDVLIEPISIYRAEISVFMQERRFLSGKTFASIGRKRDEFEQLVTEVVRKGIEAGTFKAVAPARVLAFAVIGVAAWAHTWLDPRGAMTPRQIGDAFGEIVVDGLRAGSLPGKA